MINPLISCLCVTRNSFSLLSRAIDCFDKQTYPNKELVILCEDNNPNLSKIKQLESRKDIVLHVQPALPKLSLGKLRNLSIQISHGEYFCQWDDDDWYHPNRIQDQYSFIMNSEASGCFLNQRIVYDSIEKQLYLSDICKFEGSIMMKKSIALKTSMYSNKNKAEDTDFVFPLIRSGVLIPLHAPHLYVYTHHENNVWHKKHFEEIFNASQKIVDKDLENKLFILNLVHKPRKLRPFILTCDQRLETFKIFVESYKKAQHSMLQPIVLAGYNHPDRKTAYNQLISSLDPHVVLEQGSYYDDVDISRELRRVGYIYRNKEYLNIQKIMTKNFPNFALQHSNANEDIIFFEDDGLLSSQFPAIIQKVSQYLQSGCDFLTLYSANNGYKTLRGCAQDELVHPIDGACYYGNICVALKRDTIKYLANNWKKVEASSTAWDLRWGISLQNAGFKLYATRNAYVQHQTGYSTLERGHKNLTSDIFIK